MRNKKSIIFALIIFTIIILISLFCIRNFSQTQNPPVTEGHTESLKDYDHVLKMPGLKLDDGDDAGSKLSGYQEKHK
ncbi:hypothetical protein [Clostridium sp. D33t1_170424_F3]|uniref:hypothetical protein n=1 Tax=Clostridium sp. D33t1_170424_F3 TaxID=2787099 RepID=UPI0018AB123B|nr:hypothetical protein [Clostridium sp. D33t1_170424_F3]